MNTLPKCYGIIPARFQSQRFPGKPLAEIQGKPMFWHVYRQAAKCPLLHTITLATDDERIYSAAETLAVPVLMTDKNHPSGTDRVLEAALALGVPDDAVVVNIQGDEPLLSPEMLDRLIAPFASPGIEITTLAYPIDEQEAASPDRVKVVVANDGRALYFSRARIPFARRSGTSTYLGHIGLYAFRMAALRTFQRLGPGRLETAESLEQLRLLENGLAIHVGITDHGSIGVDTPDDLVKVTEILRSRTAQ